MAKKPLSVRLGEEAEKVAKIDGRPVTMEIRMLLERRQMELESEVNPGDPANPSPREILEMWVTRFGNFTELKEASDLLLDYRFQLEATRYLQERLQIEEGREAPDEGKIRGLKRDIRNSKRLEVEKDQKVIAFLDSKGAIPKE